MPDPTRAPVVIATDLTEHSEAALVRGRAHAEATGVPFIVLHVIPDVFRHHPLAPTRGQNDAILEAELTKKAAELVSEQVGRVLQVSADDYRVVIETGDAEDEIVRVAEVEHASLVAVGARPRDAHDRVLGHVAERVVRYGHSSVLVARAGRQTGKIVVATDFTEGSTPAVSFGALLIAKLSVQAILLHVMELPRAAPLTTFTSVLGSPWMPPPQSIIDQLAELGRETLEGLAREHRFSAFEQVEGAPAGVIAERAAAADAELIVMGSHGRTGLRRLLLGSTAEKVIRASTCSVLVARPGLSAASTPNR